MLIFLAFSGATITLIGGIISVVGVIIGLYGAHVSSKNDEDWRDKMDGKTTTILDSQSDRSKADAKLIEIREENFRRELERNQSNVNIDQILENSANIRKTSSQLEQAEKEARTNEHEKMVGLLRSTLILFNDQTKIVFEALKKRGIVTTIKPYFSVEDDRWSRGGGYMIIAQTKDRKRLIIQQQPSFGEGGYLTYSHIHLPGLKDVPVNLQSGITIEFSDKTMFNIPADKINDIESQKLLVEAATRAINESVTFQLSK